MLVPQAAGMSWYGTETVPYSVLDSHPGKAQTTGSALPPFKGLIPRSGGRSATRAWNVYQDLDTYTLMGVARYLLVKSTCIAADTNNRVSYDANAVVWLLRYTSPKLKSHLATREACEAGAASSTKRTSFREDGTNTRRFHAACGPRAAVKSGVLRRGRACVRRGGLLERVVRLT